MIMSEARRTASGEPKTSTVVLSVKHLTRAPVASSMRFTVEPFGPTTRPLLPLVSTRTVVHRHAAEVIRESQHHEAALERGRRSNPRWSARRRATVVPCSGRCSSPAVDLCHSGIVITRSRAVIILRWRSAALHFGADRDRRNIPTAVLAAVPTSLAREDLCHPTHRLVDSIHRPRRRPSPSRGGPHHRLSAAASVISRASPRSSLGGGGPRESSCTDPVPRTARAHHRRVRRVHRVHRVLRARLDPHRPRDARPRADLCLVARRSPRPFAGAPASVFRRRAYASSSGIGLESWIGESIFTSSAASTWRSSTSRVGSRSRFGPTDPRRATTRPPSVGASRGHASHARVVRSRRSSRARSTRGLNCRARRRIFGFGICDPFAGGAAPSRRLVAMRRTCVAWWRVSTVAERMYK